MRVKRSEDEVPLTMRFDEKTSIVLNKVFLVDLISKSSNPFLNHDSAVRALLEEHYGKSVDELYTEFESKKKR